MGWWQRSGRQRQPTARVTTDGARRPTLSTGLCVYVCVWVEGDGGVSPRQCYRIGDRHGFMAPPVPTPEVEGAHHLRSHQHHHILTYGWTQLTTKNHIKTSPTRTATPYPPPPHNVPIQVYGILPVGTLATRNNPTPANRDSGGAAVWQGAPLPPRSLGGAATCAAGVGRCCRQLLVCV